MAPRIPGAMKSRRQVYFFSYTLLALSFGSLKPVFYFVVGGFWFLVCCSVLLISWLAELWVVPANTSSIINEQDTYKNWRTLWITSQEPYTVQPAWIWGTVYCPDFPAEWFPHQVLKRPTFPTMRSHVLVACLLITLNYSSIQIIEPQILHIHLQWTALSKVICRTFLCQCLLMRTLL